MEGTNNLFLLFFDWWYRYLPHRLFSAFEAEMIILLDLFSVRLLFATMFAPWHRDIISAENLALPEAFQVFLLNLSSRFVGFVVKIFVLLAYLVFLLISILIFVSLFIIWLAFPLIIVGLIFFGFRNIFSNN